MKILLLLLCLLVATPVWGQSVSARNKFKVGRGCLERGEYDKALEYLEESLKEDPSFSDAYYLEGLCYLGLAKYDKARERLEKTIQMEPAFLEAYAQLGNVFLAQKKYPEARAHFKKMLAVQGAAARATYCLGVVDYVEKDLKAAERQWREAARLDPKMGSAHYNLGVLFQAEGKHREALMEFTEASGRSQDRPLYLLMRAVEQNALGDKDGARVNFEKARKLSDTHADVANLAKACMAEQDKDWKQVDALCTLCLKENSDMTYAMLLQGRALEQLKKPEDARKSYQAALDSDPNCGAAKLALEKLPKPPEASPTPAPPQEKAK